MSAHQDCQEISTHKAERSRSSRPWTISANLSLIPLVGALLVILQGGIDAQESEWREVTKITGREAQAVAVALREFQKHQGTKTDKGEPVYGDLGHYDVELRRKEDILEVAFSPELGPVDRTEGTVGGRTQYGIATAYEVSLKTLKILRQTFYR